MFWLPIPAMFAERLFKSTLSGQPLFLIVWAKKAVATASFRLSDSKNRRSVQRGQGFATLVDGPVVITSSLLHLDVCLIHGP